MREIAKVIGEAKLVAIFHLQYNGKESTMLKDNYHRDLVGDPERHAYFVIDARRSSPSLSAAVKRLFCPVTMKLFTVRLQLNAGRF